MINKKTLLVIVVLTIAFIAAAGALLYQKEQTTGRSAQNAAQPLFPGLIDKINNVTRIVVQTAEHRVEIVRRDNRWIIPEKGDYPADAGKVKNLLVGTAQLEIVAAKTRSPERFDEIGVEDISKKDAKSTLITLYQDETRLAGFILGREKHLGGTGLSTTGYYIRRDGENQSWLTTGHLPAARQPGDWLDKTLLTIDQKRIAEVTTHVDDKPPLRLRRLTTDAEDFLIMDLPEDREVTSQFTVNNVAQTFAGLTLEDVAAKDGLDLPKKPEFSAELTTFDGLAVTLNKYSKDESAYIELAARFDESAADRLRSQPEKDEKDAEKPADNNTSDTDEDKTAPEKSSQHPLQSKEDVLKEVEALNQRFAGRYFIVPSYRLDNIAKSLDDLTRRIDNDTDTSSEED